jgi:hypothetical protein
MWASGINAFVCYSLPQVTLEWAFNVSRINASKHKGSPYSASASAYAANAALAVRADGGLENSLYDILMAYCWPVRSDSSYPQAKIADPCYFCASASKPYDVLRKYSAGATL